MRCLVGFLCICALGVVPLVGCSETECAEPSDIAGVWEITATNIWDSCSTALVFYTFPLTIAQDGNTLSGETGRRDSLTGTVCGDRIQMSGVVPGRGGGTTSANLQLTISADGNSMQGSDTWTSNGLQNCEGAESLSGTRAGDDVCDWGFGCPCLFSLDRYCTGSSCPTYEQALAAAENRAVQWGCGWCEGSGEAHYGAGRCGDLRYVESDCGEEDILYFDASGTLVAARFWTDDCGHVCAGSCTTYYGFRPECEREEEQNFCDQDNGSKRDVGAFEVQP